MSQLQKFGGIAALYEAAAYIVGMIGFLLVLDASAVTDPVQRVAYLAANQTTLGLLHLVVYVIWGVGLVVLSLALHDRLRAGTPSLAQVATAFALIWAGLIIAAGMIYNVGMETAVTLYAQDPAQAATVWLAIESVQIGLGGGNEIVGGIWVLLLSVAALRSGALPRFLNYLGLVVGAAGLLSVIPALNEIGIMLFGLGQIFWFIWLGIVLLRRPAVVPAAAAFVPSPGLTTD
jgi:hypothetical protein